VYTRWQNSYNVIVSVFLKARLQIMTSAVSHYIILQVNYIITSNNWIRSPSAFKSLIGLVSVMIFRLREHVLLLLPLKIRGFCCSVWGEGFSYSKVMDAVLLFYIFHMVNCVYFSRGPLAGEKERGWGCYKVWEKKK